MSSTCSNASAKTTNTPEQNAAATWADISRQEGARSWLPEMTEAKEKAHGIVSRAITSMTRAVSVVSLAK